MSDTYNPTSVTPAIPVNLLSPLEKEILTAVFGHEIENEGDHARMFFYENERPSYFFDGPHDLDIEYIKEALSASSGFDSRLNDLIKANLENPEEELDLENHIGDIFQDIIRRSENIHAITILTSFGNEKIQNNGGNLSGGAVFFITKDAQEFVSTDHVVKNLLAKHNLVDLETAPARSESSHSDPSI